MGKVAGAGIEFPVAKVVQVLTFTAQPGGKAQPKKHALQSCDTVSFCQEYGETPFETVIFPFVSTQAVRDTHGLTIIEDVTAKPQLNVKVTTCVPTPAIVGVKVPFADIPGPLQVPVTGAAEQLTPELGAATVSAVGASVIQIGPTGEMSA